MNSVTALLIGCGVVASASAVALVMKPEILSSLSRPPQPLLKRLSGPSVPSAPAPKPMAPKQPSWADVQPSQPDESDRYWPKKLQTGSKLAAHDAQSEQHYTAPPREADGRLVYFTTGGGLIYLTDAIAKYHEVSFKTNRILRQLPSNTPLWVSSFNKDRRIQYPARMLESKSVIYTKYKICTDEMRDRCLTFVTDDVDGYSCYLYMEDRGDSYWMQSHLDPKITTWVENGQPENGIRY